MSNLGQAIVLGVIITSVVFIIICLICNIFIDIHNTLVSTEDSYRYSFSYFFGWQTQVVDLLFVYVIYVGLAIGGVAGAVHYFSPKTIPGLWNKYMLKSEPLKSEPLKSEPYILNTPMLQPPILNTPILQPPILNTPILASEPLQPPPSYQSLNN